MTTSVSRASVASVRRCASSRIASSHGSPRTVALPRTTIRRTSRAPVRLATAVAKGTTGGPDDAERELVTRGGRLGDRLDALGDARAALGGEEEGAAQDRRHAGHGLEAAELAAVAGRAVGLDDDVADLAGPEAVATEQLAVEHQPGADPVPDLDRDQVVRPLVALEQERGEGGGPAVVGDDRRQAVVVGEALAERQVRPGQVDRPADRAVAVDDARRADADPQDRAVRAGEELVDQVVDDGHRGVAVRAVEVAGDRAGGSRRGG